MGQGARMSTYPLTALEKANRLEHGGMRVGVAEEVTVAASLPDI